MKNQLVKESYAEKWEDIVRSGNPSSPPQAPESGVRLPAEFGTKDKVPAKGTAPMGPSDYADGSQWTERDGNLQRREHSHIPDLSSVTNSGGNDVEEDGAKDKGGYFGGDGASLNGAARPASSNQSSSSNGAGSVKDMHLSSQQRSEIEGHLDNQPQGSGQLPDQGPSQPSNRHNGATPPASKDSGQAGGPSSGSDGASTSGRTPSAALDDSDWWREVTAASKKADCEDTAAALAPKQGQSKAGGRLVDGSKAKSQAEQDILGNSQRKADSKASQNGAVAPSSSSQSSEAARGSGHSTHAGPPSSSSSSQRASSRENSSETPKASANSSRAMPHSPQEQSEMKKKTQEVKEVASKIEGQIAGASQSVSISACFASILCSSALPMVQSPTISMLSGSMTNFVDNTNLHAAPA